MKKVVVVMALLICFSVTPAVEANRFGSNSLLTIPTADILPQQNLSMSYHMIDDADVVGFSYGLNEKVQVGANLVWNDGLDGDGEIDPSVKVNLLEENNEFRPEVSLGVFDRDYYLVASKNTNIAGIRAHAGLFSYEYGDNEAFVGVSKVLNPVTISTGSNNLKMPVTTVMGEYNEGLNLGAKFRFTDHISADLGVVDATDESALTLGINFENKF
ncbi:hypothetical protein [Halanaerobacter jeridensis]|uniref:Exopolysaccharide biosynthesis protein YbjH n=1 Tax=Halanaerobacter jeridensis TaxID=706427 RepID=A0A939BPK7_9FIRM|nr:hypothetical protein [Halanaerobacter jeridensis]MBM7556988.1 hypothetical protein [Halanaerobacter jeridensis]